MDAKRRRLIRRPMRLADHVNVGTVPAAEVNAFIRAEQAPPEQAASNTQSTEQGGDHHD